MKEIIHIIDEIEKLVDGEDAAVEILPNGDVVVSEKKREPVKTEILTYRRDLGSNY